MKNKNSISQNDKSGKYPIWALNRIPNLLQNGDKKGTEFGPKMGIKVAAKIESQVCTVMSAKVGTKHCKETLKKRDHQQRSSASHFGEICTGGKILQRFFSVPLFPCLECLIILTAGQTAGTGKITVFSVAGRVLPKI